MFMSLSRRIDALNEKIANAVSWALLLAVVICAGNALVRYLFKMSSNSWLEIQWYLFAALFMLASAHTLRRDEHVRIDVVTSHFSRRAQVWIDLFGYLVFLLPVCLVIVYYGVPFARYSIASAEMSSSAGGLIVWPVKLLIPLGFALLALQGASEIIKRIAFLTGATDDRAFSRHASTPQADIAAEIEAIKAANKL